MKRGSDFILRIAVGSNALDRRSASAACLSAFERSSTAADRTDGRRPSELQLAVRPIPGAEQRHHLKYKLLMNSRETAIYTASAPAHCSALTHSTLDHRTLEPCYLSLKYTLSDILRTSMLSNPKHQKPKLTNRPRAYR